MEAHCIPYIATASAAYPEDLLAKIFPLYEVFDGERIVLNLEPPPIPLEDYIHT